MGGRHDDSAIARLGQVRPTGPSDVQRSPGVNIEVMTKLGELDVGEVVGRQNAGVVHDDVDPSIRLDRTIDESGRARWYGDIGRVGRRGEPRCPEFVRHSFGHAGIAVSAYTGAPEVVDHHAGTTGSQ